MKKIFLLLLSALISFSAFAKKDEFVGFYKGPIEGLKVFPWYLPKEVYAEVYRGPDGYRLKIQGGIMSRAESFYTQDRLKAKDGEISFSGKNGNFDLSGNISPDEIVAKGKFTNSNVNIKLARYKVKQPTLGEKAPDGAIVLFDGKDTSKFEHNQGKACLWEVKDGAMTVNTGLKNDKGNRIGTTLYSKDGFDGAFKLHLEFKIPTNGYHLLKQARNNSGIFIGDYEIQILDSFGTEGMWDDCGALYRLTPAQVNACLEPGAWQTYDITFKPAKFKNGKSISDPTITVFQNGVKIHCNTIITRGTSGARINPEDFVHQEGPKKLTLQDHTNPISFRNIWVLPIK